MDVLTPVLSSSLSFSMLSTSPPFSIALIMTQLIPVSLFSLLPYITGDNSVLLATVYELDTAHPSDLGGIDDLENNPAVWRYRPRITVEQFFRHFHLHVESRPEMRDKFKVIRLVKAEVSFRT
jgi:hypothetical protein